MNVPLVLAGVLALGTAVGHALIGETIVLRKLSLDGLPSTRFGGPSATKAMIRVAWHLGTIAYLALGSALVASGSAAPGDVQRGVGFVAAGCLTGFAALAVAAALREGPRLLLRHPAPGAFSVVAALAWWGTV